MPDELRSPIRRQMVLRRTDPVPRIRRYCSALQNECAISFERRSRSDL